MDSVELLAEIQRLASSIETTYIQIGRLLCQARNTQAYLEGGFDSVETFAEASLRYKPRKTKWLMRAAEVADRWEVTDEEQREIGPSKLMMIEPVLTEENKAEWFQRARQSTTHSLKNAVAAARGFPVDERKPFTVLLDDEQLAAVEQALALALRIAGTESRAVALVCMAAEAASSWQPLVDAEAAVHGGGG